jgi:hypothetical protein
MVDERSQEMTGTRVFLREPILRLLILGLLFVAALGLRLYGINHPPMEFYPVRQYHGALLARGFYEWLMTGNLKTVPPDGIIEPPILELATSLAYLVFGEHLWIPRLLSTLCWMVGGVFLYLIAKRIVSPNAAVFSVFFYLFVPYSVFASRAFMSDPLMVMLMVASIFTILNYHERPSTRRLIVAAVASSIAIFAKPGICLFQLFGAFVSLAVYRQGVWRSLISSHSLIFAALSTLPTGLYYLYGTVVATFLRGQASGKVDPQLLLNVSFWRGWIVSIWVVVGAIAFVGALFGILLVRKGLPRALMIGLWSGYLLFGLTFTHHIHTHSYYSLQLIPVVALSMGPVGASVMTYLNHTVNPNHLGRVALRSYGTVIVLALSLSVLIVGMVEYKLGLVEYKSSISHIAEQERVAPIYARYVATLQEIGEVVDHSDRTLFLYGCPRFVGESNCGWALMYHGRLSGHSWQYPERIIREGRIQMVLDNKRDIDTERRFSQRLKNRSPEYFIMSKGWWKVEETKELRRLLTENFPVTARGADYVVFHLTEKT